mmetsp:Transcript_4712/g.5777  ORF Transcript_4712/g.5777 Transcript_4712/m.5777 type:complete len:86 (-) Transcript_4712:111-368(-)
MPNNRKSTGARIRDITNAATATSQPTGGGGGGVSRNQRGMSIRSAKISQVDYDGLERQSSNATITYERQDSNEGHVTVSGLTGNV